MYVMHCASLWLHTVVDGWTASWALHEHLEISLSRYAVLPYTVLYTIVLWNYARTLQQLQCTSGILSCKDVSKWSIRLSFLSLGSKNLPFRSSFGTANHLNNSLLMNSTPARAEAAQTPPAWLVNVFFSPPTTFFRGTHYYYTQTTACFALQTADMVWCCSMCFISVCVISFMKVYPPGEGGHLWGDNQQLIARPETTKVKTAFLMNPL